MPQIPVYIRKNTFEVLHKLMAKTKRTQTEIIDQALINYFESGAKP